jgi:hypothetical protein
VFEFKSFNYFGFPNQHYRNRQNLFDFGSFGGAALLISNFIKKTIHYWTNATTLSNPHYTVSNKVIF